MDHWVETERLMSLAKLRTWSLSSLKWSRNLIWLPPSLENSTHTYCSLTLRILMQISMTWSYPPMSLLEMVNLVLYFYSWMVGSIFNLFFRCSIRASSIMSGLYVEKNYVFWEKTCSYASICFLGAIRASTFSNLASSPPWLPLLMTLFNWASILFFFSASFCCLASST